MYMPALKNKQGELRALQQAELDNIKNILPLLQINEATEDVLAKISSKYKGKFLIDTRELEGSDIKYLHQLISDNDAFDKISIAFPASLLESEGVLSELGSIDYIEINKDYLENPFFISWLKLHTSLIPNNIILDLGYVDNNYLQEDLELIMSFLTIFKNTSKNVFILSGSIPAIIPTKSTENYECPRFDYKLFKFTLDNCSQDSELSNLEIIFGDYTTVSPIPIDYTDKKIVSNVQIKYTTSDKYILVRNGQRKGNYNLSEVCEEIVNFSSFNKTHCWADKYIADLRDSTDINRGNPSTWASLGIEHHIVLCAE
ncbi:hypothetical protein YMSE1_27300 [Lactiplantibacillus plantarum]|uniref:beta family protein n=1 Tax=Lactiplantibacillus plantarum TaxID=1590 RepID=UPI0009781CD6|nr:hypothetical protein [Lactiplantibacillus plantarum]MCG0834697.1 hypothetical protein [Lactiplantibacillus plantarum]MCT0222536.1 hypothetical protein [Lactiplantibacillus plantarum]MCW6117447.1 beta family protein [Lactiplantibacillus plantarum]